MFSTRPVQTQDLLFAERSAIRRFQEGLRTEQVVQQLSGSENRPHPIERLADPKVLPHAFTHNLRVGILASARSKRFEKQILHDLATRIVGSGTPACHRDDSAGLRNSDPQTLQTKPEILIGSKLSLAV